MQSMIYDSRLKREYYNLREDNNTVDFYSYTWIDEFEAYAPSENYTFKLKNEGYKDWKNWAALLVDLAFAAIPFVTGGGGQVVKLANVADDISDFSKVTVIGESMSRVQTISQFVNATDNLYDGFKSYKKLSSLGKGGKVLAEIGGKSSNIAWLYGKLRSGYKVIDIGIDTVRTTRSSSYIVERITIAIWKSRNIWKWIYHLDF